MFGRAKCLPYRQPLQCLLKPFPLTFPACNFLSLLFRWAYLAAAVYSASWHRKYCCCTLEAESRPIRSSPFVKLSKGAETPSDSRNGVLVHFFFKRPAFFRDSLRAHAFSFPDPWKDTLPFIIWGESDFIDEGRGARNVVKLESIRNYDWLFSKCMSPFIVCT